jgi:hypothetical protein
LALYTDGCPRRRAATGDGDTTRGFAYTAGQVIYAKKGAVMRRYAKCGLNWFENVKTKFSEYYIDKINNIV